MGALSCNLKEYVGMPQNNHSSIGKQSVFDEKLKFEGNNFLIIMLSYNLNPGFRDAENFNARKG